MVALSAALLDETRVGPMAASTAVNSVASTADLLVDSDATMAALLVADSAVTMDACLAVSMAVHSAAPKADQLVA